MKRIVLHTICLGSVGCSMLGSVASCIKILIMIQYRSAARYKVNAFISTHAFVSTCTRVRCCMRRRLSLHVYIHINIYIHGFIDT